MTAAGDITEALFTGLIDYAGLFPPERRDMPGAVSGYREARNGDHAFVAGRFIVPGARLLELARALDAEPVQEAPWPLSVLVDGAWPNLGDATSEVESGLGVLGDRARLEITETRIPATKLGEAELTQDLVAAAGRLAGLGAQPFFEIPLSHDWPEVMEEAVTAVGSAADATSRPVGAKLRCGGLTADLFPTPEQVAQFILACHAVGVPYKCTAGLHHPVRHTDPTTGFTHHGFLNVLAAALLAERSAPFDALVEVVAEEDPAAFVFDGDELRWDDWSVPSASVRATRRDHFVAYGSCSFTEPTTDLIDMGLL